MLRFALVRAVEIIGEAASKVSFDTRATAPLVPWPAIVSMRNRLIHAYFDIDHDVPVEDGNRRDTVPSVFAADNFS